jgi:hypothetical protein
LVSCTQKIAGLSFSNHSKSPLLIADRIPFKLQDIIFNPQPPEGGFVEYILSLFAILLLFFAILKTHLL